MNFLRIAWRDFRSMLTNRIVRVSVIGIIVIPLLYSLLYLAAFWDPYSRLQDMPVAVVNLDKGGEKNAEAVNYGKNLVNKLKDDKQLGWRFVTKDVADKGVKGSKYYAEFIIPKDFSEKVLSAKNGKPQQPDIIFSANEKRNFLAAQINGKVEVQLKATIVKTITNEYVAQTFDSLYEVKNGFTKAAKGSSDLKDGMGSAKDGGDQLKVGIGQIKNKIPDLASGVQKLADGSDALENGVNTTAVDSNGSPTGLKNGVNSLNQGLGQANNGTGALSTGIGQFKLQAVSPLVSGINQLNTGFNSTILPGIKGLKDGANQLASGLKLAQPATEQLSNGADKLSGVSNKLSEGANQLDPSMTKLVGGASGVSTGVDTLIKSVSDTQAAVDNASTNELGAYLAKHKEALADPDMLKYLATLKGIKASEQSTDNTNKITALQQGAAAEAEGMQRLQAGVGDYAKGAQGYATGAQNFSQGATTLTTKLGTAVTGTQELSDGADTLYAGSKDSFGAGLQALNNNTPALSQNMDKLNYASKQLASGMNTLSSGSNSLVAGVNTLSDGTIQLKNGLGTLNGSVPQLADGANKLYDGSSTLSDGMNKLYDGSGTLYTGLNDGSVKLNNNLINSSTDMGAFISDPLSIKDQPVNPVANYGTGFAPYFIPLSLWVGALMMFFVITDKVDDDISASSLSLVAGKYISYGFIGTLQALLVSTVVLTLGLHPTNIVLYYVFNIFMSFTFIAIIQCLVFLLGQVGRALAIVLLILQLTACAGTFPLEIVPKLFKVLNPYMPFTYCVSALREVISATSIDYGLLAKDFTVLGCILAVALVVSVLFKGHADKMQAAIHAKDEN